MARIAAARARLYEMHEHLRQAAPFDRPEGTAVRRWEMAQRVAAFRGWARTWIEPGILEALEALGDKSMDIAALERVPWVADDYIAHAHDDSSMPTHGSSRPDRAKCDSCKAQVGHTYLGDKDHSRIFWRATS